MIEPDLYYGWNRKTNEFLSSSGWSKDPDQAFGMPTRDSMWSILEKQVRWYGPHKEDFCVSLGIDLLDGESS
jgi:hypothetical protein